MFQLLFLTLCQLGDHFRSGPAGSMFPGRPVQLDGELSKKVFNYPSLLRDYFAQNVGKRVTQSCRELLCNSGPFFRQLYVNYTPIRPVANTVN